MGGGNGFYVAIRNNRAEVVNLKLTRGIRPSLPHYRFIGPFNTTKQAEQAIPFGTEYKGQICGLEQKAK